MSVLAPPEPPRARRDDDPELLIREARRRQRRRRIRAAAVSALALAAVAAGVGLHRGAGSTASAGGHRPFADGSAFSGHGRLAFVSRGSLYVLDGDTGRLVRVTGTGAGSPAFSPDGRWLTYLVRGRVGLARSDGTRARTLPTRLGASWLPDGRLLAGRTMYRIAADGTPRPAGRAPGAPVAWAPDGSRYAFVTTSVVRGRGAVRHGVQRLEIARSLNGARRAWWTIPQRFTPSSGWRSPAIDRVVVLPSHGGVLVWLDPMHSASLAADGLPVYLLAGPGAAVRRLGTTVGRGVSVARTGSFALGGGVDRIAWVTRTALSCRAGGCTPVRSRAPLTLDPALAPDGSRLAYVGAASEGTTMGLVQPVLRRWYATRRLWIDGRAVPDSTGAAAPVWSSDGRSLLFAKDDALWLLPRAAAKPVRVAGPLYGTGAWPNSMGSVPWSAQFAWHSGP